MNVTLINPNIVTQKGDYFSSGIPYMPITLAFLASYLKSLNYKINVIDSFGEKPTNARQKGNYIHQGISDDEVIKKIPKNSDIVIIYAGLVVTHEANISLIRKIRDRIKIPIMIIENSQSVVAYSLKKVASEFFDAGADFIITGEPEFRVKHLLESVLNKSVDYNIDGVLYKKDDKIIYNDKKSFIKNLDDLPFPAWEFFPLENYWKLGYSHAPLSSKKYMPLLTSRGCPYPCRYCVVPETNNQRWRPRSAKNVFEEIKHWYDSLGVDEFHIEDLNPTIQKERIKELSRLIIDSGIKIKWKIAAGTKIETIDEETIDLMAKSGCVYISLSPESGSIKILRDMNKPFDHKFGVKIVKYINSKMITSQACFVVGFPGEDDHDRKLSKEYVKELVKAGIDEVALFIMTPIPGSWVYEQKKVDILIEKQQMTFSPTWRYDYKKLNRYRWNVYFIFFLFKLLYHPIKLLTQPFKIISKRFNTKMEMTVYRAIRLRSFYRK